MHVTLPIASNSLHPYKSFGEQKQTKNDSAESRMGEQRKERAVLISKQMESGWSTDSELFLQEQWTDY